MYTYLINLVMLILLLQVSLCHAIDTIKVNEKDALFTVFNQTSPVITTSYIGWGDEWKWAGVNVQSTHKAETGQYRKSLFKGKVQNLDIKFKGSVVVNQSNLAWNYNWQKSSTLPNAKGFGMEFNFDLPSLDSYELNPKILADNSGWYWKNSNNESIEVTFSPSPAKIYFERGQKNKIRVLFFSEIAVGSLSSTMSVKTTNNVKTSGPDSLSYKALDSSWHKDIMSPLSSPVDLSFLNKNDIPAGKKGFIKRKKDQLFFENGTPAKFWGANIQAYALFNTSDFDIKRHAKRIAQLGINLIRIHHHDSGWVKTNVFKKPDNNTLEFSDTALKKIDWWVKCLKDEGVYLWLDLHVGRRFTKNDGISEFSDFSQGKDYSEAKGFNYYNQDVQSLMQAFNDAYLTHVNPFTQLAYKDDPAVIALLVTNENDLTHHFGNALLGDKNVPVHHEIFSKDVEGFSNLNGVNKHKAGETWSMGESKIYLNDVEHRFNQKMIDQLDKLGVKSLVATTNSWGGMGLSGLPSLTDGSIVDAHSYGRAEEFKLNPRHTPGFLTWVGAAQVSGKPLSVTEWNIEPFPASDRFTTPIYTAGIASFQSWDAIMLYGYSQEALGGQIKGSNYSTYNDPAMMGLMPAAALLYRQGHVLPAKKTYELKLDRNDFFFVKQDPQSSKTIRTLLESSRLTIGMPETPELSWLKKNTVTEENSIVIHNANQDFIPEGQNFVESDTKEMKRDWKKGIHTINTAKSQVASGWIGGETIALTDVNFKVKTKNAVVAVQSLENKPIRDSNKIFITAMARSQPDKANPLPFVSEPVIGQLEINAPKGLKLYPINSTGKLDDQILIQGNEEGKYIIDISNETSYHWFLLQNHSPSFDFTSPTAGSGEYVEGDLITFKTNASQQAGNVSKITYLDGEGKSLGAAAIHDPYELAIRNLSVGKHNIVSRVTFEDGTYKDAKISLTIGESPFRITYPYNGDQFVEGRPIAIKVNAIKWEDNVKQVGFWKDDWKYLHNSTKAPYDYMIRNLTLGEHLIRSRITYNNGTKSDSNITIKVVKASLSEH